MTNLNDLLSEVAEKTTEYFQKHPEIENYFQKTKTKISERTKKYFQDFKKNPTKGLLMIATGLTITALAYVVIGVISYMNQETHYFPKAYEQALIQHADTNQDRVISTKELNEFNKNLFQDKNVMLIEGETPDFLMKYVDGTQVSIDSLTSWVKNYKPEQ